MNSRKLRPCGHTNGWPEDNVKMVIEDTFETTLSQIEIQARSYIPGEDHGVEIETLTEAIGNLVGNLSAAKPGSATAAAIMAKMDEYESALDALNAKPTTEARWDYKGTGETYGDWWEANPSWEARGERLRNDGIRFILDGSPVVPSITVVLPTEIERRVQDSAAGTVEAGFGVEMDEMVKVATGR